MKAISEFAREPLESRLASELETLGIFTLIDTDANKGARSKCKSSQGVEAARDSSHCQILSLLSQKAPTPCNCFSERSLILSTCLETPHPHNPNHLAGETGCVHLLSCPPPDVVLGSRPPAPPTPTAPGIPGAPIPGGVPLCLSKLPGLEK